MANNRKVTKKDKLFCTYSWILIIQTLNNLNLPLAPTFSDSPPGIFFLLIFPSITQTPNLSNIFWFPFQYRY